MKCPNCGSLNAADAKFCKKCGNKLQTESLAYSSVNKAPVNNAESDKSKNILIICVAAVICVLIVACAFIYVNGNDDGDDGDNAVNNVDTPVNNDNKVSTSSSHSQPKTVSSMKILGGSFSTGSSSSAKTYAHIYVGSQYAGQNVKITAIWSRNGNNLNNGNILTRPVESDGYINFNSADAFKYYPDHGLVKLYDLDGNLIDTMDVNLSPTSGTQSF